MLPGIAAGQNAPASGPGQALRVTATEVVLDLVARDKNGRLVKNLKAGDVEVYEDGVRQQILSFRLAEGDSERGAKAGQTAVRPLRAVNPVCVVFHNLGPVDRKHAVDAAQEFLQHTFPRETYVGLFVLDDHLRPVYPFTANPQEVKQAAQNVFNRGTIDFARASAAVLSANPNQVTGQLLEAVVTGGEVSPTAITGADVSTGAGANAMRGDKAEERGTFSHISGMRGTDQIITMIDGLASLPGRKSVLLLSTGLITTGEAERFAGIVSKAAQAGLTIYTLDARGLDKSSTAQAGEMQLSRAASVARSQASVGGSLDSMRQRSRQMDDVEAAVRTSDVLASLRALSESTGGFLIANTNDYRKPFQRIVEDLGTRYEAVYRPVSSKYDGRLRTITVKPSRADLSIESRTGYFAMPEFGRPPAPFETAALAILSAQPQVRAFDFRAAAFHFRSDGNSSQNAIALEIPAADLSATPNPGRGTNRVHISLLALVKDAGGQVVDKFTVDAPYDIPDANLRAIRASSVTYTHPVRVPPGRYTVETAVIDREGRRSSTNTTEMEATGPRKGADLSSIVLVERIEPAGANADPSDPLVFQGQRTVPMLGTKLSADAKPNAYFVVYPDKSNPAKPQIQVEFVVGGQVLAKQGADLPDPDATGAIPMVVGVATRPGECELRITALQGNDAVARSVKYTVAGK